MDSLYSTSQSYGIYEPPWGEESKSAFGGNEHDPVVNDKALEPTARPTASSGPETRRPSMLKVEDDFTAANAPPQMWHDRHHEAHPVRSYSQSHLPMMNGAGQPFIRMNDPAFPSTMPQPPQQWSVPHSGASTPTPLYSQVYEMSYAHAAPSFPAFTHDPASAVSMSPQSSQGGWASATSSDGTDQRGIISPTYRPPSPGTVVRPDGIRKKNARFEIPKERNLANIDAMILASTDENEKKELKQQKRLLRNRQAALDSRQRKKTHTEKLEQEKKISEKKMYDLEEALARSDGTLAMEREEFMRQRQHLENLIHTLQYERDEAIRTKTLETAELRRQNNALKDCVRELERQQSKGYVPTSNLNYPGDYNQFDWEDEFNLIDHDELKMDENDHLQRQVTPKPPMPPAKLADAKAETGFSWNTFYMCLLFGAFIASNNNNSNTDNSATSAIASSIPPAEASNVLKTVLSSGGTPDDLIAARSHPTMHNAANGLNNAHVPNMDGSLETSSSLENLHQTLATPSRRQETAALFSLSASSYQHLTDPFNEGIDINVDVDADADLIEEPPQQTPLQKAFASMQAQKDNLDRLTGMGNRARERNLVWDSVPPEVIKNFETLVQKTANGDSSGDQAERMEQ